MRFGSRIPTGIGGRDVIPIDANMAMPRRTSKELGPDAKGSNANASVASAMAEAQTMTKALPHCRRRNSKPARAPRAIWPGGAEDRKSVVSGKSVAVRVDLGGSRIMKKKTETHTERSGPCRVHI